MIYFGSQPVTFSDIDTTNKDLAGCSGSVMEGKVNTIFCEIISNIPEETTDLS